MKARVIKLLLPLLALSQIAEAQTNLQDTRNFFSEYRNNPVPGRTAAPNFYHGSDIYSAAIEGPEYTRLGLEWEAGILFFLGREDSNIDGKYMHHGFNTSFGVPLARRVRPNHYLNLELMAAYDDTGPLNTITTVGGTPTATISERSVQSYSLLINYKYYTPPILRERVFPHLSIGVGNTFKQNELSIKDSGGTPTYVNYSEWDNTIFTMKGEVGIRARLTKHLGLHTGYHLIYMGDNHKSYPAGEIDGDFVHALDLGLSLTF